MKEQLVSFEVAKLLKEKNFEIENKEDFYFYCTLNNHLRKFEYLSVGYNNDILAPTQSLAQKWLREVHGIHVTIDHVDTTTEYYYDYTLVTKNDREYNDEDFTDQAKHHYYFGKEFQYKTYEEALEEGLKQAITLIKDE